MDRDKLANFLGFLATSAITAIGLSMNDKFVGSAIVGLGIQLKSGFIESACASIKKKWVDSADGLLNHDIQKSLQRSIVAALKDMQQECLSGDYPIEEKESIEFLFNYLIENSKVDFFEKYLIDKNDLIIKDLINKDNSAFENDLTEIVYTNDLFNSSSLRFKHYFKKTLVNKLKFWFTEDLKGNRNENIRARIAYTKILLESIETTLQEQQSAVISIENKADILFENSIKAISEAKSIQESLQKLFPLFPSFSLNTIPVQGNQNADRFYDGFPPLPEDLKSNFDFPRNIYIKPGGIKSKIEEITSSDTTYVKFILIRGVGGSGKSTLLKRIAYDQTITGKDVFVLNSDWIEDRQISTLHTQIKHLTESYPTCIIIMDEIVNCILREQINIQELFNLLSLKKILFVIADQPDRWNTVLPKVRAISNSTQLLVFDLHQLDDIECNDLADKMSQLELLGKLSIRHLNQTKEERILLCKENSKRHFVVAMLQIRYGRRFSDIIVEEYEKIPSEKGKEAYLMVCFCHHLGFSIPETIILEALQINSPLGVNELHACTEGVIIDNRYGYVSRHPVISREICRNFLKTKIEIFIILKQILSSLKDKKKDNLDFLDNFLSKENIHKIIVRLLEKDYRLIEEIVDLISASNNILGKEMLIKFMCFNAMIERLFGNDDRALEIFNDIITNIDEEFSFAYRQIAWIKHQNRDYEGAALNAVKSYQYSDENPEHIVQVAKILSLNTVKNFRQAKSYFVFALEKSNGDRYYQKEFDKYSEAERELNYFIQLSDDDFIPDSIIKSLRPGLNFIKAYYSTKSVQFKNKLISVLHGIEGDTKGTVEELNVLVDGFNVEKDKLVCSKYYGNLGRILYLQWYRNEAMVDTNDILKFFEKSLSLNPNDPFIHCWLGTYHKEIKKNFTEAKREYEKAIKLSEDSRFEQDKNHPIFPNNLALLIMDDVAAGRQAARKLLDARDLLDLAVKSNTEKQSNFYWAEHNLSKCKDLIEYFMVS